MKYCFLSVALLLGLWANAQPGCTDPLASNYNPAATKNDGSCVYNNASVSVANTMALPMSLQETSGLYLSKDAVLTHNDNSDINLYFLDTLSGAIKSTKALTGITNIDWEDMDGDSLYYYIGDFGNNGSGNRRDLRIYRISKSSLVSGALKIDTLKFSYANQSNFNPTAPNETDFDCEAMVVGRDSIYLFTKEWLSQQTTLYSMAKTPGSHTARVRAKYNVSGLITGATLVEDKNLVVLCGYSSLLQPFLYLLYDFENNQFFAANKRKLTLNLGFHQVEGIATQNGLKYYVSNENFVKQPIANNPQKLHTLDLSSFLSNYLNKPATGIDQLHAVQDTITLYPVPATGFFYLQGYKGKVEIISLEGKEVAQYHINYIENRIDCSGLAPGTYFIKGNRGLLKKLIIAQP